jgi:DNA modification methylase
MNQLYYGDNLQVLREHIADASVDLIYLDPPFNSKRDYNLLFTIKRGGSAGRAGSSTRRRCARTFWTAIATGILIGCVSG